MPGRGSRGSRVQGSKGNGQARAPLLEALIAYARKDKVPFHTPGHKQGRGIASRFKSFVGENLFKMDLTVLEEVDCLFHPVGVIREAQELAAKAYGADRSFFLLNGTSGGNHAMLMTPTNPGDSILVCRHAHRSILAALILTGVKPVYILPELDEGLPVIKNLTPQSVRKALQEHPGVKGLLIVSPNYHGVCANLAEIAGILHEKGKLLLVDEAHGPHLHFHPGLPQSAMAAGADMAVQSTHKIIAGMTQASLLHVQKERTDLRDLESVLRLLGTTSPSYILMASLDAARMQMATQGTKLLDRALNLAEKARKAINTMGGLYSFTARDVAPFALDVTKLTVKVSELGLTGYEALNILNREYDIQPEMADLDRVLFIITFADTRKDIDRLLGALEKLVRKHRRAMPLFQKPGYPELEIHLAMSPREAFFARQATVPFKEAVGKVSTELFAIYPPGLPVIAPGELITHEAYEYLKEMDGFGGILDGPADKNLNYARIVAE